MTERSTGNVARSGIEGLAPEVSGSHIKYCHGCFNRPLAVKDYEPRVVKYTDQLLAQIQATQGMPINVTDWFNFYSFDVMGDLAFGKSFNMLRHGVKHYFMKCLHADMQNVGYLAHVTWLFPFLKITPVLNTEHLKFWSFCTKQVAERRQVSGYAYLYGPPV